MRNMHRLRAAGIAMLVCATAVLPSCTNIGKQTQPSPPPDARQETQYKEKTVARDVQATAYLIRAQGARDTRNFVMQMSETPAKLADLKRGVRQFLKEHPELKAAAWVGRNGILAQTAAGWPEGMDPGAHAEVKKAVSAVRGGASYASELFSYRGEPYFAIGEPSSSRKGEGAVVLVPADEVRRVEIHQRQNLRLVPYPAEGRYKTESADPGTGRDVTVRTGEDNQNASHYAVDEIVVKFPRKLDSGELLKIRKDLDVTVVKNTGTIYVFRSKTRRMEDMREYFKAWKPIYTEPHYLYLTNLTHERDDGAAEAQEIVPNDTLYSKYQWNLPQIATERGWNLSKGSQDVIVAVVDTGVELDHPDLKGRLVEGFNVVDPSSPPNDDVGHGTHVAGIIAAQVNNQEGVAGMTWYTRIMPIKALDSTGAGSAYAVAEGVIWAADHGAQVINLSLGNYAQAQFLHDAIRYAVDKGVVVVAASGNDNTDRPGYPAAYPEVIAVAATDPGGGKAAYSNYGDYIDVSAPGTSIASTYPGSKYAALSGTSMACPHVAALAALIKAADPNLTPEQVAGIIRSTASDLGDPGKDPYFGHGEINVQKALETVRQQTVVPQYVAPRLWPNLNRIGIR